MSLPFRWSMADLSCRLHARSGGRHHTRGLCPECVPGRVPNRPRGLLQWREAVYALAMAQTEAGVVSGVATTRVASRTVLARTRVRVGFAVFTTTSVACAVATALDLRAGVPVRPFVYIVVFEAIATMGLLLTSRLPRHRISWVLALAGLWWGSGALSNAYAAEGLVGDPGSLPWGLAAAWYDNWAWLPGIALLLGALLVLMPDGQLPSRRSWPISVAVIAGTVLTSLGVWTDTHFEVAGKAVDNPLALDTPSIFVAFLAGIVLVVAGLASALVAFVLRYRRSEGDAKQQLRWVLVSFA